MIKRIVIIAAHSYKQRFNHRPHCQLKDLTNLRIYITNKSYFTPPSTSTNIHAYTRTHARMHAHTHACMHARTHAHMHARTHAHTQASTCTQAQTHVYSIHVQARGLTHTCIHAHALFAHKYTKRILKDTSMKKRLSAIK